MMTRGSSETTMTINLREENAYTLGAQAGRWGTPPSSRRGFPQVLEAKGIGHNSFQKFDRLKSAVDRFVVTPNNFTIDGYAIVDLADGPVVIHVPKLADDRSFIVQVGDAFRHHNRFAHSGANPSSPTG
jgi:hypothetical protein